MEGIGVEGQHACAREKIRRVRMYALFDYLLRKEYINQSRISGFE